MEDKYKLFLQALKAALENEKVQWEDELTVPQWLEIFQMAERHHILPLIYEAVYSCPAAQKVDKSLFAPFKQRTVQTVMLQTMKTSEFLTLYQKFAEAGVMPIVVKGIICRSLYPNPDYRISGDEDIVIPEGRFFDCHDIMLGYGMECAEPELDIESAYEVPYGKKGSPIYIEAHKSLFPPDSEAYGEMNSFFDDVENRTIVEQVDGTSIRTMGYTDHLFYLICHAMKHWLHSGCGIRQVCDIVMMANNHGQEIDWILILNRCKEIRAELFTAAIFKIGEIYLSFDIRKAYYPDIWRDIQVDETPLLMDILTGGVYGAADSARLHSSTVTLNALEAQKKGKSTKINVLKSIFPSAKGLQGRYPYLQKYPYLLPVAWVSRIWKYSKELDNKNGKRYSASDSIKIGEQRIELLKQYGVLDSKQ